MSSQGILGPQNMLQVWYSNSLEKLVDGLVEVEASERKNLQLSPIERSPVVVPGANMGTFLKYAVARRAGIAARMQPWHIGNFFEALLPEDGRFQVVSAATVQILLLDILSDDTSLQAPELARVRAYLAAIHSGHSGHSGKTADSDARALRRFQLSAHIARLFEEYHLNRPKMLAAWSAGNFGAGSPEGGARSEFQQTEIWQRALWLQLFGEGGRIAQIAQASGVRYLRPDEIFEAVAPKFLRLPAVIHFFALDRVGGVYEKLLRQLGELTRVHIWALNPCMSSGKMCSRISTRSRTFYPARVRPQARPPKPTCSPRMWTKLSGSPSAFRCRFASGGAPGATRCACIIGSAATIRGWNSSRPKTRNPACSSNCSATC